MPPSEGDYTGYRAGTMGWEIRDNTEAIAAVGGGGSALTGWETDEDGNLVNSAPIVGATPSDPVVIASAFTDGSPQGEIFRVVSNNNWNPEPFGFTALSVDEAESEVRVWGYWLSVFGDYENVSGHAHVQMRSKPSIGSGDEHYFWSHLQASPHTSVGGTRLELQTKDANGDTGTRIDILGTGAVLAQVHAAADDPTADDVPAGYAVLWQKTGEAVKLWANRAGSMVSVALA